MVRNRPSDNSDYDDDSDEENEDEESEKSLEQKKQKSQPISSTSDVQVIEREITLSLINEKLNFLIGAVQSLVQAKLKE